MTGRKTRAQRPRVRRSDPTTRSARQAKKREGTDEKRTAAKKVETEQTPRKSTARAQAAAPLLAHAARKIGALDQAPRASKPQTGASYQPKTEPPATPVHTLHPATHPAVGLMAMAHSWMALGWRMTAAGLAFQARMAKAALDMPPTATAMRQGAEAFNAWLSLMQTRPDKARKD